VDKNELIETVLNRLEQLGATYGDIRVVDALHESVSVNNGKVESADYSESLGFGVRAIVSGSWGFASSSKMEAEEAVKITERAVKIAQASALAKEKNIVLDDTCAVQDTYTTPHQIDPFTVPLEEKVKPLLASVELMRKEKTVKTAEGFFSAFKTQKTFASLEGAHIDQTIIECGGGISCVAFGNDDMQVRSYPSSFRGNFASGGYEFFKNLKFEENAERVGQEAGLLLTAKPLPAVDEATIIIAGNQLGLQIHESCGHPIELDRVFGMEAAFAGTSFLTTDNLDKLKYGSDIVNITMDSTIPGALGTFGYDDEGVKANRSYAVKDGLFVGYLMSRETAPRIKRRSNGAMRAEGWYRIPLVRMTNVSLLPGTWKLPDLLKDSDGAYLFDTNRSWSIDDKRRNFQFATEIAWLLKGGKKTKAFKNPTYTGMTTAFWNGCDAICNQDHWQMWGTPNCGKGEPMQTAHTGHGAAPSRFRKVKIFGG